MGMYELGVGWRGRSGGCCSGGMVELPLAAEVTGVCGGWGV